MTSISEKSISYTSTKTFNFFEIEKISVSLKNSADIIVNVYMKTEENKFLIDVLVVRLDGEAYLNWGTDDTYIETYVANYLENL